MRGDPHEDPVGALTTDRYTRLATGDGATVIAFAALRKASRKRERRIEAHRGLHRVLDAR